MGGADTVLVARPPHLEALRTVGLRLASSQQGIPVRALAHLEDLPPDERSVDWLILAVKTFDVQAALAELEQARIQAGRVLAIQNGVGTDDLVSGAFGAQRTFAAAVTRAVAFEAPGCLAPARRGGLAVAPLQTDATPGDLLTLLQARGVPAAQVADARSLRWSKLLLNLVANASCAILDTLPASVLGQGDLYRLEIRALREALRVMRCQGVPVIDLPGYPVRVLARAARNLPTWFSYPWLGPLMAAGRGQKPPSLLLDLRAGRSRTEVPWMNGAVAREAALVGISAPVNRCLARVLGGLTSGEISLETFRHRPLALLHELALESPELGGSGAGTVEGPAHERT